MVQTIYSLWGAAKLLGVRDVDIKNFVRAGKLEIKMVGGQRMFTYTDLCRLKRSGAVKELKATLKQQGIEIY